MNALENLAKAFARLPGIGQKSANRIAYSLIKNSSDFNKLLGEAILTIKDKIHPCKICGSYSETEICPICSDSLRDKSLLCIVEQPQDVESIKSASIYNGLFHVLGGAINPLNGIGPENLSFDSLLKRIDEGNFKEIIIATNPTEEGDTTALYIRHLLNSHQDIILTRLASGLPIGGDLEYADRTTLSYSLRGRTRF